MDIATAHPEDVKTELRKRFGSVANFERTKKLPEKSVHDVLRRRTSKRVSDAITTALATPLDESEFSDSTGADSAHRLNAGAR